MKESVKGIIMIFSCHKHKNDRMCKHKLSKTQYNGYKVFYVLGNPNITDKYIFLKDTLLIKCEDSYIHLLKKVIMSFEIMNTLYDIQEGIIRCGDDIVFDENKLINFIEMKNKPDYCGKIANNNEYLFYNQRGVYKKKTKFMFDYYVNHQNDFTNSLHNINVKLKDIKNMEYIPNVLYTGGVIFFVSIKSIKMIVKHFVNINYDIFTNYERFGYPYIIEDVGIGFILNQYKIKPKSIILYADSEFEYANNKYCFGTHTNYKK